jgi:hypothetical protein
MILHKDLHKLLLELAKRINPNCSIWYNCSLAPKKKDVWRCFVCNGEFVFVEYLSEIDAHGLQHLKDSNLLPSV